MIKFFSTAIAELAILLSYKTYFLADVLQITNLADYYVSFPLYLNLCRFHFLLKKLILQLFSYKN